MKAVVASISVLTICILIFLGIYFFSGETIETAINNFEDQDYIESMVILNRLVKLSGYEKSEKINYYKCRAINKLAEQLEDEYSEELTELALEKKGTPDFDKLEKKILKELKEINSEIKGDLGLVLTRKKSRIISRGKFYDEFVTRYRGSSMIEDLDYEELLKIKKTEPDRYINSMLNFYKKYPNTNYISHIVKMLFKSFQIGVMNFSNKEKILWDIIVTFGRRYPTSPEINKIYLCKGDNVNLRTSPSLEGKIAGKIIKDDILIQLEKSMDTSQIGDVRDYWYRIVNLKGLRGWIFGKFLSPYDVSVFKKNETDEKWSIEENFTEWEDSHTPKNWTHIPSAEKSSINFTAKKDVRIATINSPVAKSAGLFTRYNASRAFTIQSRAKYITGKSITIFVYVLNDDKTFYIKLKNEEIDVSGRSIPIHTSDWHEYMLTSEDGKFASLYVDGELISGRIPPVTSKKFPMRGIYCLFSSREEESKGEMEFIKVK